MSGMLKAEYIDYLWIYI